MHATHPLRREESDCDNEHPWLAPMNYGRKWNSPLMTERIKERRGNTDLSCFDALESLCSRRSGEAVIIISGCCWWHGQSLTGCDVLGSSSVFRSTYFEVASLLSNSMQSESICILLLVHTVTTIISNRWKLVFVWGHNVN